MAPPSDPRRLRVGARVLIAAVVPAVGEEDRPLLQAAVRQVEAAGGVVAAQVIQRRGVSRSRGPGGVRQMRQRLPLNLATWLGKGKVEELVARVAQVRAEAVLIPHPLSATQRRNLERLLGVPVLGLTGGSTDEGGDEGPPVLPTSSRPGAGQDSRDPHAPKRGGCT